MARTAAAGARTSAVRRALLVLVAVVAGLAGCDSGDDREPTPEKLPPRAITRAELGEHLAALQRIADAHGDTRAAGTPGYDASAAYVAARLRDAGWSVTRQAVPFTFFRLRRASLVVAGRRLRRERDFQVLSYSGSGRVSGTLRAAGDGCSASDFAAMAHGEIALVGKGGCFFRDKAREAERAGARAVLAVEGVSSRRGVPSATLGVTGVRIPVVVASLRALRGAGNGDTATITVRARSRRARTDNVIAETPGGSADRIVMAGGHLDSVAGGPGINDNGSAIATLIEAAEAIGPRPRGAKVRFAFWAAEELGLIGSRYYVSSLDDGERDQISVYINLDQIGSPNAVPAVYVDGDKRLEHVLVDAVDRKLGGIRAGKASDHAAFQAAGIPVSGLYTGASERGPRGRPRDPCYHLACDTLRNVDRALLLQMARAVTKALKRLSAQAK